MDAHPIFMWRISAHISVGYSRAYANGQVASLNLAEGGLDPLTSAGAIPIFCIALRAVDLMRGCSSAKLFFIHRILHFSRMEE